MAKGIVVDFAGEEVAFDLERVDRDKLCGKKALQVVDAHGNPCSSARLTRDGGTVIPTGGLSYVYVPPESGVPPLRWTVRELGRQPARHDASRSRRVKGSRSPNAIGGGCTSPRCSGIRRRARLCRGNAVRQYDELPQR